MEVRKFRAENDPIACRWWVEWGGKQPPEAAVPALCALLQPPKGAMDRLRWRGEAWGLVRAAAVEALSTFNDPRAIEPLVHTLVYDPNPYVRSNTAAALCKFGSEAVPEMLATLRRAENWPLSGMNALLRTLGDLKDQRAGPLLAKILFGDLPLSPSRWKRQPFVWSASLSALVSTLPLSLDMPLPVRLLISLMAFLPVWSLTYLMVCLPIGYLRQEQDRSALAQAAADALIALRDKNALPSMLAIAFGAHSGATRAEAFRVLRALLPLIGPEDAGLVNAEQERRLLDALGSEDAELALVIVRVLEFIGTGQAVGPVERLLRRYRTSELPNHTAIRNEAERILPLLQVRLQREQAASVLLRPSQEAHDAPTEMLRPVLDPANTPAEQLLRSTSEPE
ncbi:MAG TPA: HEAT repeat domain-containing protein [Chthonomonadaceae bacterium]|nr:HEAT repeat domain-containing protein [Chthonomonadaceae bacterium]